MTVEDDIDRLARLAAVAQDADQVAEILVLDDVGDDHALDLFLL